MAFEPRPGGGWITPGGYLDKGYHRKREKCKDPEEGDAGLLRQ